MTSNHRNRPPCHPCDQRPPRHTTKSCSRKRPISPCQPGPPPRQGAASTGTATIVIHAVNANRANAILDIFFIRVFFPIGLLLLVHVDRLEQDPRHGLCCTSTAKIRVHPKIPRCRTFKTGVAKRKEVWLIGKIVRKEASPQRLRQTLSARQSLSVTGISLALFQR